MRKNISSLSFLLCILILLVSCKRGTKQTFIPKGMVLIHAKNSSFRMKNIDQWDKLQNWQDVKFKFDYWIDSTEVTQLEYSKIMSDSIYGYKDYVQPERIYFGRRQTWDDFEKGDNYPAYLLNWYEAVLYCNALSKKMGLDTVYSYSSINGIPGKKCELLDININFGKKGYRLPTEAEWEFACRAGSDAKFYWGESASRDTIHKYEITAVKTHVDGSALRMKYSKVASRVPNKWGLYDMCGNTNEWCNDIYKHKYDNTTVINPQNISKGKSRVFRGGAAYSKDISNITPSFRWGEDPHNSIFTAGFRTVLQK